jgi:uncharacterized membrane protein YeaQ/YmgE (transglycosylase-associated protein family)
LLQREQGELEMLAMMAVVALQTTTKTVEFEVGWPNSLFSWILLGLIAGWLAGKLSRGEGFGCIGDILLGLIGSVVGGWVFTKLGIVHSNTFLYSLAAATVGAVILVSIAHLIFGGRRG